MTVDEQHQAWVKPEMIRLSVGIEHFDDIIGDLDQSSCRDQGRILCRSARQQVRSALDYLQPSGKSAPRSLRSSRTKLQTASSSGFSITCPILLSNRPNDRSLKLLHAAASDRFAVRLKVYALPGVPRQDWGRRHLSRLHYQGADELWNSNLDALIITGEEPRTALFETGSLLARVEKSL